MQAESRPQFSRVLLLLILMVQLVLLNGSLSAEGARPRFGALMPLSGDYAPYGKLLWQGIEIATEDLVDWKVDDIGTMNARGTVAAAQRLLDVEHVQLVVNFGVDDAEWLAPIFVRRRIPLLTAWDSSPRVKAMGPYVFSAGYETASGGLLNARFLATSRHVSRVAIIAEEAVYNRTAVEAFKGEASRLGMRVTTEEWVPLGTMDYKSSFLRAKQSGTQALYFMPSLPASLEAALRQIRELSLRWPIVTNELMVPAPGFQANREGVDLCGTWIPDDDYEKILKRYEARYAETAWNHGPLVVGFQVGTFLREQVLSSKEGLLSSLQLALGAEQRMKKQFALWCWTQSHLVRQLP